MKNFNSCLLVVLFVLSFVQLNKAQWYEKPVGLPDTVYASAIDELKENGFWIVGSSLENAKPYTEVDYKIPVALIVGNEKKGIRKLTADKCDFLIQIPMTGKLQSLNVSVATGILLFEILRKRGSSD